MAVRQSVQSHRCKTVPPAAAAPTAGQLHPRHGRAYRTSRCRAHGTSTALRQPAYWRSGSHAPPPAALSNPDPLRQRRAAGTGSSALPLEMPRSPARASPVQHRPGDESKNYLAESYRDTRRQPAPPAGCSVRAAASQELPIEMQRRARYNLLVGLAADEYRDNFPRGSFLIRPLVGVEREKRGLAIGAFPKVGQTIQFQLRDAAAADRDLIELLEEARASLSANKPVAGVLCSCNGRGIGMFGTHDHDAGVVARQLGPLPLAGLFCNGEIGPIGVRPFLHGFTASLALVVRK